MKYLKSGITFFIKLNLIGPYSGLSNEILCILLVQGATKLQEVEFEGLKISIRAHANMDLQLN